MNYNRIKFLCFSLLTTLSLAGQSTMLNFQEGLAVVEYAYVPEGLEIELCGLVPDTDYKISLLKDRFEDDHIYLLDGDTKLNKSITVGSSCHSINIGHKGMFFKSDAADFPLKVRVEEIVERVENRNGFNIEPSSNAQAIVEEFVGDVCGDIVEGSIVARGLLGNFQGAEDILGFGSGVVLSTINPIYNVGPNRSNGDPPDSSAPPENDEDLKKLVGGSIFTKNGIYDITVIEFDFVPTANEITFEYVFGSEEYCEYVNEFNDAFGFFLSGPGINGPFTRNAENIALIPNTNDYVAINNLNHLKNQDYYINNTPINQATHTDEYKECLLNLQNSPAPNADKFEMDGYTVPLIARADVIPCETYHLKLIIGDAFDDGFSSSVFLRSKSFRSTGDVYVEFDFPKSDSILYEGCDQTGIVRFVRTDQGTDDLEVSVTTGGTAQLGVDLEVSFGETVIIPPGGVVEEQITIFEDVEEEGIENFSIDIGVACNCDRPFYEFFIEDVPEINVELTDTVHCSNEGELVINPIVTGGLPSISDTEQYTFDWSDGSSGSSIEIQQGTREIIELTVTDQCVNTAQDAALLESKLAVTARLSGTAPQNCTDLENTFLTIDFEGDAPYYFVYEIDGVPSELIATNDAQYQIPIRNTGRYSLRSVANDYCEGDVSGTVQVDFLPLRVSFEVDSIACNGDTDAAIYILNEDEVQYTYSWNTGSNNDTLSNIAAGTYSVEVESNTCSETFAFELPEPPLLLVEPMVTQVPDCINPTNGAIDLTVTGGVPTYTYDWTPIQGTSNSQDVSGLPSGDYTVSVSDEAGCVIEQVVTIPRDDALPIVSIADPALFTCDDNEVQLDGSSSSQGNFTYEWTSIEGLFASNTNTDNATVTASGVYQLAVTNEATNCTNFGLVEVEDGRVFPTFELEDFEYFCRTPIYEAGVEANTEYSFEWEALTGNILSGRNTNQITLNQPGQYQLSVEDNTSGCVTSDILEVTSRSELPFVDAGVNQVLTCREDQLSMGNTLNGDGDRLAIEWFGSGIIGNRADSIVETVTPGVYSIRITNESNGCFAQDEVVIEEDKVRPLIDAGTGGVFSCTVRNLPLNGENLNLDRINAVTWTSPNGIVSGPLSTYISEANAPGRYFLTAEDEINGCISVDSVDITPDPNLPLARIDGGGIITCVDSSFELSGITNMGNQTTWTFPDNQTISNQQIITGRDSGVYVFEVLRTSDNCINKTSVSLDLDLELPVDSIRETPLLFCNDPRTTLETFLADVSSFDYSWTSTDGILLGNTNRPTVEVEGKGFYNLQITRRRNGCTLNLEKEVEAFENVPTDFSFNVTQPNCPGDLGAISIRTIEGGVAPYSYSILGDFSNKRSFVDLLPGDYEIEIQDANGCILGKDSTIVAPRDIFLNAPDENIIVDLGDPFTLNLESNVPSTEIDTILYTPALNEATCNACLDPTFVPLESGTYTVQLVDTAGCRLEAQFPLAINDNVDVFVPNIFGPNFALQENQRVGVYGKKSAIRQINNFYIIDRWGEVIFQRENFQIGDRRASWDGTYRGELLNTNVFIYFLEAELINGRTEIYEGDILLSN